MYFSRGYLKTFKNIHFKHCNCKNPGIIKERRKLFSSAFFCVFLLANFKLLKLTPFLIFLITSYFLGLLEFRSVGIFQNLYYLLKYSLCHFLLENSSGPLELLNFIYKKRRFINIVTLTVLR